MRFLKGLTRFFHFEKEPAIIQKPESAITRRNILLGLGATALAAAMPKIPLGRVWSIPKKIVYAPGISSVALQLEAVNDLIPCMIETDCELWRMVKEGRAQKVSTRSFRIALRDFSGPLPPLGIGPQWGNARYGNALAGKLDRTIVEPVRSELEDVLELVGA